MNRLDIDGTPLWTDKAGHSVMMKEDQIYSILGASTKDGIYYVFYYVTLPDPEANIEPHAQCYVEAYDTNGNLLWNRPVLDDAIIYRASLCYQDYMMKPIFVQGSEEEQEGSPNAAQKRALASVEVDDGLVGHYPENGMVLLPNNFNMPFGIMMDYTAQNYYVNYFSKKDWEKMEANGAVFLTAGGQLDKQDVWGWMENNRNTVGSYWVNKTYVDKKKDCKFTKCSSVIMAASRPLQNRVPSHHCLVPPSVW